MSVQTDKMPPVPSLVPMVADQGPKKNLVTPEWNRWLLSVLYKIDVVNQTVVEIGKVVGDGFAVRNPDGTWTTASIVTVGSGGTGKNSVTAGSYLTGDGTNELVEKTPSEVLTDIGAQPALGPTHTSATGGSATALPAQPVGYVEIDIGGTTKRIPYYD